MAYATPALITTRKGSWRRSSRYGVSATRKKTASAGAITAAAAEPPSDDFGDASPRPATPTDIAKHGEYLSPADALLREPFPGDQQE